MSYVKSFRELDVYKLARKVSNADSEQLETQHWLEIAEESEYISVIVCKRLLSKCESIGKMIQSMMDKSAMFCKKNQ